MDNTNLDHGSLFDSDCIDAMRYLEVMLGIPQKVILNGKEVGVRVEVKSSLFLHMDNS
jgi:hypothetical protein